ncbi:MAG: DUF2652 domain-containing protein [Anaerolineae bacterium]|nr:DUF2652 domain-containing protein [Anaerolineae bacterium]
MTSAEKSVVLIIADISGYTRFMVEHKAELIHAQVTISELIQTIIRQVEIPLEVSKLEGDAVFMYAVKDEDEAVWAEVRRRIGQKLLAFFEVFAAKIAEMMQTNVCECNFCTNLNKLRLKLIVHSGQVLFYTIGRFEELSGVDVILVHRLLKNSVQKDQYILMTEAGYRDIEFPTQIEVMPGQERYDAIGEVRTLVYVPPAVGLIFVDLPPINRELTGWPRTKHTADKVFKTLLVWTGLKKAPELSHAHEG